MVREEFYLVVQWPAVRKWEGGCEQTQETFPDWWDNVGKKPCSFCRVFRRKPACGICPIKAPSILISCAKEWDSIDKVMLKERLGWFSAYIARMSEEEFVMVHKLSKQLLQRIRNVEYKPEYMHIEME